MKGGGLKLSIQIHYFQPKPPRPTQIVHET